MVRNSAEPGIAMRLSIVIPALDEAGALPATLAALAPLRARGHEVIVVDGGSKDGTPALAAPLADRVIAAPRGRARQMNAGAAIARGEGLIFLHADTRLPEDADRRVAEALAARAWGRFDVAIEGRSPLLRVVAASMNWRSRLTGIATGDQAIFVRREAFERAGGYPDLALMEDIVFSRRMKALSRPACIGARAITSGRRWERHGVVRTIVLMWRLRLAFFFGVPAEELARRYARG
jgi:rSAM/selenodomain-associated transferase 2